MRSSVPYPPIRHLGLLPEEIDATTGEFLENHPMLFSYVEHIRARMALDRAKRHTASHGRASHSR